MIYVSTSTCTCINTTMPSRKTMLHSLTQINQNFQLTSQSIVSVQFLAIVLLFKTAFNVDTENCS